MENNCKVIAVYTHNKDRVYRKYYLILNGVYTPINCESNLDFIQNNLKNCTSVYAYENLQKVIKGELSFEDLKPTTYKEYKAVYVGV